MKLLIVDPDRDLVEMVTSWLKTLGYEVYRAYTGERAKIEWEEQEPDLVLNEVSIDGKMARLTPTESKLLHLLAVNANNVCTASQIVSYIWGFGNDGDTALIKAHIRHLRQKIEPDPSKPNYILTVPGVGYTLIRHSSEEGKYSAKEVTRALREASV
jgi:DNA-binding response OmpR family regulator